jgi:hypothetical protein
VSVGLWAGAREASSFLALSSGSSVSMGLSSPMG